MVFLISEKTTDQICLIGMINTIIQPPCIKHSCILKHALAGRTVCVYTTYVNFTVRHKHYYKYSYCNLTSFSQSELLVNDN